MANRRGAMALLVALMLMLVFVFVAYSVDFGKIGVMRSELHTGADAGSLAAAVVYLRTRDSVAAKVAASEIVALNAVLNGRPIVDSIVVGHWNDQTATWTPVAAGGTPVNGFQVWTRSATNYVLNGVSEMGQRQIRAAATAWAEAPVAETDCVTPWAVPYDSLTTKIDPAADPLRALTQSEIDAFLARPIAERTLTLKVGTASSPGNFFPVDFPPYWKASTGTYGEPESGAEAYSRLLQRCELLSLGDQERSRTGAGDSLQSEPGNKQGPTMQGAPTLIGYPISVPLVREGQVGRAVPVAVVMLAGFTVTAVSEADKTVTGYFTGLGRPGRIGGPSLVRTAILVQ